MSNNKFKFITAKIKQSVISVASKPPLKNKIGNPYLQNFTSASARCLYWFHTKLSPYILQQDCAHEYTYNKRNV